MIKSFSQFIREAQELDPELLRGLEDMEKLGLISKDELRAERKKYAAGQLREALPYVIEVMQSPEAKELYKQHGLELISSKTQLINGNLIFARPGYDRDKDHALGFFSGIRKIRRMTPKNQSHPYMGFIYNPFDQTIKQFTEMEPVDFFRTAMRWALDKIDFTEEHFPVIRGKGRTSIER